MLTSYATLKQLLSMREDAVKAAQLVVNGGEIQSRHYRFQAFIILVFDNILTEQENARDIYVVFPPIDRTDYPTTFHVPITNNDELRDFVSTHQGNLVDKTGLKLRFQQLENGGVYTLFGPHFMGLVNDARTQKVRNKMREVNSLLTVRNELVGFRQLYFNIMVFGHCTNEILLHKDTPDAQNATAFICESSYDPCADDVHVLQDKASKFETLIKSRELFRSVDKVVPVLTGHDWKPDTLQRAKAAGMWMVRTGGEKYQVIRGLCTIARRWK